MTTLERVRAKVIEAVPGIERDTELLCSRVWEAWDYGTMTQDDFEFVPRPIRLSDVLVAVPPNIVVSSSGDFYGPCETRSVDGLREFSGELLGEWNLRADSLDEQSDETIAFLAKILGA